MKSDLERLCEYMAGGGDAALRDEVSRALAQADSPMRALVDHARAVSRQWFGRLDGPAALPDRAPPPEWLASRLVWQEAGVQSLALRAAVLAVALGCRVAARTRNEPVPSQGLQEESAVLMELESSLAGGVPVSRSDPDLWVHVAVSEAVVKLRAGRSPGDRFDQFQVEFRRGADAVLAVAAHEGVAHLTQEHFLRAQQAGATQVVIRRQ